MEIEKAINMVKTSLVWCNWTEEQAKAFRALILEAEKVKILEEENAELRKRFNKNVQEENEIDWNNVSSRIKRKTEIELGLKRGTLDNKI